MILVSGKRLTTMYTVSRYCKEGLLIGAITKIVSFIIHGFARLLIKKRTYQPCATSDTTKNYQTMLNREKQAADYTAFRLFVVLHHVLHKRGRALHLSYI